MTRRRSRTSEFAKLRASLPQRIHVRIRRARDGGFVAHVREAPDAKPRARTFWELVSEVNAAFLRHAGVPTEDLPYFPTYLPPAEAA